MKKEELIQRLEDIEWEDFEVKEAKSEVPKSSWETVSAFSNTAGGWLIFGVCKKGKKYEIIGIENPEKTEQDFTTALRGDKFNKKIIVQLKKYKFSGKPVLGFYIPSASSKDKPIYFNTLSNTFIRTGSGTKGQPKMKLILCSGTLLLTRKMRNSQIALSKTLIRKRLNNTETCLKILNRNIDTISFLQKNFWKN